MSAVLRTGYKQTEVGVIPEDWEVASIGNLCSAVLDCHHSTPVWTTTGEVVIRNQNIREGKLDLSQPSYTDAGHFAERTRRATPTHGDLVITREAPMGLVCMIPEGLKCCLGQRMVLLRPDSTAIEAPYLLYSILSEAVQRAISVAGGTGSTVANLRIPVLKGLLIAAPSPPEQRAIAAALSDVDALLGGLDMLIAKKQGLKVAAMQQLLTGQSRLPGFSGVWEVKRLGEMAHIKTGKRNNEDKVEDGTYPFFVRSDFVERINSYSHDCEAILVPGEGRIGDIFHYINGRFDVHQRVYAITQFKPGVSAKFVQLYMRMHFGAWAMQNTVKATVDSLRLPTFENFEMQVPPTEDEQIAITTILSDMDTELAALQARRSKTQALKQAMMQELLTGRIRLI